MREKKYFIYGIILIIITLIGITLAYFSSQMIGEKRNLTLSTAELKIIFTNGKAITGEEIEPGWSIIKTFSVENKTKDIYKYNIVIEDLINTFKTEGYLVYKITSTNDGYNMYDYEDVPKSDAATDTILAYSVEIPVGVKQEYTIEIKYINSETENQNIDMGSILQGKLYISEGDTSSNLFDKILADNPTISTRTDFSGTNTANTTGTIYSTDATEDGSTVYYYSGNTTNNWVSFGGFYWRIIRTNEDGSIRILYSGTSPDTTEGYIDTSTYNESADNPIYVGYMYGTNGSIESNRTNENDSTIKQVIDAWYENNLLANYDKYISKTAIYCNDRSIVNGLYSIADAFDYGPTIRLFQSYIPTYKCGGDGSGGLFESTQAVEDKFSVSTTSGGNGQLDYPIALVTGDEIAFAGGKGAITLAKPYAWYYTNSAGDSITGNLTWSTMSSDCWDDSSVYIWNVLGSSHPGFLATAEPFNEYAVRPVISLKSCITFESGDGTSLNPYIVSISDACAILEN